MFIFQSLFLNNLRSKTLGRIQNRDPRRLMFPIKKSKTIDRAYNNVEQSADLALYACRLRSWLECH